MAWFNVNPALLQEERDALTRSGYQYEIDETARAKGHLVIKVSYKICNKIHIFTCYYPPNYSYFAVRINCRTFPPGRHLNPYSYDLCLFENAQSVWNPKTDTLAKVLNEQIPKILKAHAEPNKAADIEGNVGYQITGQMLYEVPSVIFVDDWDLLDSNIFGHMTLKLDKNCNTDTPIRGFVESLQINNDVIAESSNPFANLFTLKQPANWVKLDRSPASINRNDILIEAIKICPKLKNPDFKKRGIDIVGLVFPEESGYLEPVLNWVFVIRRRLNKANKQKNNISDFAVIRSDRFTKDNILSRVPRLRALSNKRITLVGAGALGSHLSWQLARAGVKFITIIDHDIVQAGNVPRWMLGFLSIGLYKVDALNHFLLQNFPDIECIPLKIFIGVNQKININGVSVDEHEFLSELIRKSDILIDTVAETNISFYLSDVCQDMQTSYVWATGTQGSWGGIVGRVIPGVTEGTWIDFSHQYAADAKTDDIPLGEKAVPPAEEGSDVQPVGCFDKTFTGTGFDMDHISLMATRVVVATLLRGETGGYPDFDWDVGILHLWDEATSMPIAPKWKTRKLARYDKNK